MYFAFVQKDNNQSEPEIGGGEPKWVSVAGGKRYTLGKTDAKWTIHLSKKRSSYELWRLGQKLASSVDLATLKNLAGCFPLPERTVKTKKRIRQIYGEVDKDDYIGKLACVKKAMSHSAPVWEIPIPIELEIAFLESLILIGAGILSTNYDHTL